MLLFSYGTLQYRSVQLEIFGRELAGRDDALAGYQRQLIPILDPAAAAKLGETHYANIVPTGDPADAVSGTVYEITASELSAADQYEEDAGYRRISVTLRSGLEAWVYLVPH